MFCHVKLIPYLLQESEGRVGQLKQELEVTREREGNYARERAELSTQLADTQKAKANLECELESHFRSGHATFFCFATTTTRQCSRVSEQEKDEKINFKASVSKWSSHTEYRHKAIKTTFFCYEILVTLSRQYWRLPSCDRLFE